MAKTKPSSLSKDTRYTSTFYDVRERDSMVRHEVCSKVATTDLLVPFQFLKRNKG